MKCDVAIVGAGPAGLAFARSLAPAGLNIVVLEKQAEEQITNPKFDGRDIALTHLSVRLLKDLGIWERMPEEERLVIRSARVINGTSPYTLDFDTGATAPGALGYMVSNHVIRKALIGEVRGVANVEIRTGVEVESFACGAGAVEVALSGGNGLEARLLVAADSRYSETRRMAGIPASMHDFGRVCIVSRMTHERPHDSTAFECFHYERTLAVLPLSSHESSIVVTANMSQRDEIMTMSDEVFADDIRRRFGGRYGNMRLSSERFAYPLVGVHARRFYAPRIALVGDAAVGMHPVTAHGFNLGLSGASILADLMKSAAACGEDVGAVALLQKYSRNHQRSTRPMYHGTNEIVKFFTDDRPHAKLARAVALRAANRLPFIRRAIRHKLTFA